MSEQQQQKEQATTLLSRLRGQIEELPLRYTSTAFECEAMAQTLDALESVSSAELSRLEAENARLIAECNELQSRVPTEQVYALGTGNDRWDPHARLLLNAYGRRCWDAGHAAAGSKLSALTEENERLREELAEWREAYNGTDHAQAEREWQQRKRRQP